MTDQQINEKLATEVMGALKGGYVEYSMATGVPKRKATYAMKGRTIDQSEWNPLQDLNQLRECYEVAENDWVIGEDSYTFGVAFCFHLWELIAQLPDWHYSLEKRWEVDQTTAWVKYPRLVALAILKAAGVEVE